MPHILIRPTDEEDAVITAAAMSDPDCIPLTDEEWQELKPLNGRPADETIPLSREVVDGFRATTGEDLGQKLLEAARQVKAGVGSVVYSPVSAVRQQSGLDQEQFATLLGVSVRTLQEWEQGRRSPTGAAKTLLRVAERHPNVLRELAEGHR